MDGPIPSLRRRPRPLYVLACPACKKATGGAYGSCPLCTDAIERYWLADWNAALADQGLHAGTDDERLLAEVILTEPERWPWSLLDSALVRLSCPTCGAERGGGPRECGACTEAWGVALWAEFWAGRQGAVTSNEHALHIGRALLRHPHRFPPNSVIGWRLTMPRVLTGWLPTTPEAQRASYLIKAGRLDAVQEWLRGVDAAIAAGVH